MAVSEHRERLLWRPTLARRRSLGWVARYQWQMVAADAACGVAAGLVALLGRFTASQQSPLYVITTAGLPLIWIAWVGMAGGYDPRLIGLGSEEFRRAKRAIKSVFDKAVATAALGIFSPLLIFIAIAILARDGGPVLFSQAGAGSWPGTPGITPGCTRRSPR
jgi:hypothetical protein